LTWGLTQVEFIRFRVGSPRGDLAWFPVGCHGLRLTEYLRGSLPQRMSACRRLVPRSVDRGKQALLAASPTPLSPACTDLVSVARTGRPSGDVLRDGRRQPARRRRQILAARRRLVYEYSHKVRDAVVRKRRRRRRRRCAKLLAAHARRVRREGRGAVPLWGPAHVRRLLRLSASPPSRAGALLLPLGRRRGADA